MPFAVLIPLSAVSAVVTAGWVEGEAWVAQRGSVGRDFKQAASGGELLGANWGGKAGDFARWLFYIPTPQQVAIHIRYSRRSEGPASFKLLVDGTEVVG
ncbi:MAG: hypothetical protein H5T86_14935, partial [Armatimonadetes bacterium]|nr:hypothetical protein [Armatimonadota bacterium]